LYSKENRDTKKTSLVLIENHIAFASSTSQREPTMATYTDDRFDDGVDTIRVDLIETMNRIITNSEVMLRGGLSRASEEELEQTKADSYRLYRYFHHGDGIGKLLEKISDGSKRNLLELSIRLHNKIRNLPSSLIETRAILKAACAWAFATLSERHDKVSIIVIKLLRKAGEEMFHINLHEKALDCFEVAINLWSTIESAPYIDQLPPLEVQDLKLAVFFCHLQILKLVNLDTESIKSIKQYLQSCFELLPYVSTKNRLTLAESLADIASKLSGKKEFQQSSISIFDKCVEILNSHDLMADKPHSASNESEQKRLQMASALKLRCYLSMAYIFLINE
jgi:hypothetical protein